MNSGVKAINLSSNLNEKFAAHQGLSITFFGLVLSVLVTEILSIYHETIADN